VYGDGGGATASLVMDPKIATFFVPLLLNSP